MVTERRRRVVADVEVGRLLHQVTGLSIIRPDQRQDVNDLDGDVVTVLGAVRVLDDDGQRVRSSLLPASREQPVDRIVVRADIPGVAHRGDEHQVDLVVDVHQIGAHVEHELANLCIIGVGRLQAHIGKRRDVEHGCVVDVRHYHHQLGVGGAAIGVRGAQRDRGAAEVVIVDRVNVQRVSADRGFDECRVLDARDRDDQAHPVGLIAVLIGVREILSEHQRVRAAFIEGARRQLCPARCAVLDDHHAERTHVLIFWVSDAQLQSLWDDLALLIAGDLTKLHLDDLRCRVPSQEGRVVGGDQQLAEWCLSVAHQAAHVDLLDHVHLHRRLSGIVRTRPGNLSRRRVRIHDHRKAVHQREGADPGRRPAAGLTARVRDHCAHVVIAAGSGVRW